MASARYVALALAGVALLVGGGYTAVLGVEGMDACSGTTLYADPADESDADAYENRVAFTDLSASQQTLAERAIDGERPAVDAEQWPWFETALLVEYRGEHYEFYTVTGECAIPPETGVVAGAISALAGIAALGLAGRKFRRARAADPE